MLENPTVDAPAAATVKRYAPPNQRNRGLGRRKSGGDRLERGNSYVNDGERNPIGATRSGSTADYGDAIGSNRKLIPLQGCSNSQALQFLNKRWTAAMTALQSLPENSAERPVLYTRKSAPAWGHGILQHLLIQPTGGASTGVQRDFLNELRQAMHNASSHPNP